ncbi:hypothetical protein PGT21_023509 [Puccinia graminis f. sp. tritici]|uniref:UFSP1/2/DUB catalytic domain-containing protein n=1 Tax=Puccinia graminis f. sp. tritici TaxID=56615 RepID=A0A5B0PYB9_PUCGR|nr:hypothetical protein PGT21_023509 [Puccinia graminis f. sp. tritici]
MSGNYQTAPPSGTGHLPSLLARLLLQSHADQQTGSASLCDPKVLHIGTSSEKSKLGAGDWAWGCGYRNLQMLFSTIIARQAYRQTLLSHPLLASCTTTSQTTGIPSITRWQQIIEDAWKAGFDPDGAAHFDGRLVGKKQWIGTTEVYVALCRLGLRCQIVDFPGPSGPNGQHTKLIQWVENYFKSASNLTDNDQSSSAIEITSRFPLYFQHDGHSRTIIGIETDAKQQPQLLILDPAKKVASPLKKISEQMSNTEGLEDSDEIEILDHRPPSSSKTFIPNKSSSKRPLTMPTTRATKAKPTVLDLHAHPKLLGAHRLTLKELSKKKQYQTQNVPIILDMIKKDYLPNRECRLSNLKCFLFKRGTTDPKRFKNGSNEAAPELCQHFNNFVG